MSKELYQFSSDKEEADLYRRIDTEGKVLDRLPVIWNGCGTFEKIVEFEGDLYEFSISGMMNRCLKVEKSDYETTHRDPITYELFKREIRWGK